MPPESSPIAAGPAGSPGTHEVPPESSPFADVGCPCTKGRPTPRKAVLRLAHLLAPTPTFRTGRSWSSPTDPRFFPARRRPPNLSELPFGQQGPDVVRSAAIPQLRFVGRYGGKSPCSWIAATIGSKPSPGAPAVRAAGGYGASASCTTT